MLTCVELYLSATDTCGWSDIEYEEWLTALLQQQLLSHWQPALSGRQAHPSTHDPSPTDTQHCQSRCTPGAITKGTGSSL